MSTKQFIQAHTPMSALADYYKTVLVVGGEGFKCRDIAEMYGFKDVIVPNDIIAWDESIAPYRVLGGAQKITWGVLAVRSREKPNIKHTL